ncbi:MAG: site-specific DNA-methyltransferase [Phycisphaerae bacterium]|nr:site-specific DNA-methyltransferase [Phycisphaerae bacterium]
MTQVAPRNRTLKLAEAELPAWRRRLMRLTEPVRLEQVLDRTICQDGSEAVPWLPTGCVDLLFADPPYNLPRSFNGRPFKPLTLADYEEWLEDWVSRLRRVLKDTASVYVCSDWRSSTAVHRVLERHFKVRNRITWEREKGRGALANWKNCAEDIWFCTVSDRYTFNVDSVKLKRRVLAPYTDDRGQPKDWRQEGNEGYRLTAPSNLWTDLTVPFWSMPENTDHPTQKPEKLLAKIVLASSHAGDLVLDPFLGSGTTSVVARKLGRHFIGIEIDETYCCLAEKRLDLADRDPSIQGYTNGVFWERNTLPVQRTARRADTDAKAKRRTVPAHRSATGPTLFSSALTVRKEDGHAPAQ